MFGAGLAVPPHQMVNTAQGLQLPQQVAEPNTILGYMSPRRRGGEKLDFQKSYGKTSRNCKGKLSFEKL